MSDWTAQEKKVARKAFDRAYQREMKQLLEEVRERVAGFKEESDIWKLEEFLRERRRDINGKYDYRYSMLLLVFARLMSDGSLTRRTCRAYRRIRSRGSKRHQIGRMAVEHKWKIPGNLA